MKKISSVLMARLPQLGRMRIKNALFEVELGQSLANEIRSLFLELETHKLLFTSCYTPCIYCQSNNGCIKSVRRIERYVVDLRKSIKKNEYAQNPLSRIQKACSDFQLLFLLPKPENPYIDDTLLKTCDIMNLGIEVLAAINTLSHVYQIQPSPRLAHLGRLFEDGVNENHDFKDSRT